MSKEKHRQFDEKPKKQQEAENAPDEEMNGEAAGNADEQLDDAPDNVSGSDNNPDDGNENGREEAPGDTNPEEAEGIQAQFLRLSADFQNYRRRAEKEKEDIYAYANEKFALSLLDVIDNFERAMAVETSDVKYKEGMEMIYKQLSDVLAKNNVEQIKAENEQFDPNYHSAVMTEDAPQGVESGTITKVLQKGYLLNKKVIRPAMVAVAR